MGRKIKAILPSEWRDLPDSKKIDLLTKLYIARCSTIRMFSGGKIAPDYFRIRNFFRSRPDDEIAMIYDYIYDMQDTLLINLKDMYKVAEIYKKRLLFEEEKRKREEMHNAGKVKSYEDITLGDIMNM